MDGTQDTQAFVRESKHTPLLARLQTRMTFSYVVITFVSVLGLEILAAVAIFIGFTHFALPNVYASNATQIAQTYAFAATLQGQNGAINPGSTFQSNQPFSLVLPGQRAQVDLEQIPFFAPDVTPSQSVAFALLIGPDGHIIASSFESRYPHTSSSKQLLPAQAASITQGQRGNSSNRELDTPNGRIVYAIETVWNTTKDPIGAIYVQLPENSPYESPQGIMLALLHLVPASMLLLLLIMTPIGVVFGLLTTRSVVRRVHNLVQTTAAFAQGHFQRRIAVSKQDEVGQLEAHFNEMANQLEESLTRRQELAGQNARLAERTRISRDLHDSVKQQIFAISMQVATALSLLDVEDKREATRQHLIEADMLSYQVQQELTTLIHELRPSVLREKGLPLTLQEYVQAWSRQNAIEASTEIQEGLILPLAFEEAFFRIAQEALSNSARHSGASHVEVVLQQKWGQIVFIMRDNGHGFEMHNIGSTSVGLHSMRERIEALGGTLHIRSRQGEGTDIEARCTCTNASSTSTTK